MNNSLAQILTVLTSFPGNLVYHLILASSVAGALQAALYIWRDSELPQGRRMVFGLGVLLSIRFLLFLAAGLSTQGFIDPHTILPILDRVATIYGLLLMIWLWVFPKSTSLADIGCILMGLLTLMFAALSWVWWQGQSINFYFNAVWLNIGWSIYALILIVVAIIFLMIRQSKGWGYGLSIFLIAALGHIIHLSFPVTENDFPGMVRLAQIAAYPILLALPRRLPSLARAVQVTDFGPSRQSRSNYGIAPNRLEPLLNIMSESTQPKLFNAITRAVAEIMLADIVLFFSTPNYSSQYNIHCGYDLIKQENFDGMSIGQDKLPLLSSAMQQSRSLRLPASSTSQDLINLGHTLNLGHVGHFLAAFVPSLKDDSPLWGVVVLSPYSNRRWDSEDQIYLEKITRSLATILDRNKRWEALQNELEATQQNPHGFQARLDQTQAEDSLIKENLYNTNQLLPEEQSVIDELEAAQRKTQETIAELKTENSHLSELVEALLTGKEQLASTHQNEQTQQELDLAMEEIFRLNQQLVELEKQSGFDYGAISENLIFSDNQIDIFSTIAIDLRQPMSTIMGYTNLLLDESVGILGALQRKYLERVSASTERMEILLDDLINVTVLEGEHFPIKPVSIMLGYAIDKAVADTNEQMREKKIILRVDLPHHMPSIYADRDALQQILIHLLKNASIVSPTEGEIFLHAGVHDEENEHYVLVQVADQGGGISRDDLPRVFSRVYRTDSNLIIGIGDTGVGLSIVKTLVEAQNGRIWVDTEDGVGSKFSLLLPLANSNISKGGV